MISFEADYQRALWLPDAEGVTTLRLDRGPDFLQALDRVATSEIWETPNTADLREGADQAPREVRFPPPGVTIARLIEFSGTHAEAPDPRFESVLSDMMRRAGDKGGVSGSLHRTQTVDYFTVVSGLIWLLAEDGEVELGVGDTAICLGGLHDWQVRTGDTARVFSVLVGAQDHGDQGASSEVSWEAAGSPSETTGSTVRRVVLGHGADGTAHILSDHRHPAPLRLWDPEVATPSNAVTHDRREASVLSSGVLGSGPSFEAFDVAAGEQVVVPGGDHLLLGTVAQGTVDIGTATLPPVQLAGQDVFVASGCELRIGNNTGTAARVSFVSFGGRRG